MLTLLEIATASSSQRDHRPHRQTSIVREDSIVESPQILMMNIYIFYILVQILKKDIRLCWKVVLQLTILHCMTQVITAFGQSKTGMLCLALVMFILHQDLPSSYLPVANKAVLITGCDRGFGHELAIKLDKMGFQVFAGCLFKGGEGEQKLRQKCSKRLHTLQLDVTNDNHIQEATKLVKENIKENKFWGVVNNAGICYIGNIEMMSQGDLDKVMQVNYYGALKICRAFLPLLRQNQGRIINVSSNAGLAPVPLMGVYCASKIALFMMSEVLRAELEPWGVKVSTVIPSGYKTGIIAYDKEKVAERWWAEASDVVKRDFGKDCFLIKFKQQDHDQMLSADLSPIVNAMVDGLLSKHPKPCYYKGFLARSLPFMYQHLPSTLSDPVMKVLANWFDYHPSGLNKEIQT